MKFCQKQIRILFIDDQEIGQELNKAIVSFNHKALCDEFILEKIISITALSLKETEEVLNKSKREKEFPNIIVSDIQLIEGTGFDFLELFKNEFLKDFPKTVISLISAYITDQDKDKFKNYPFAKDILERPLEVEQLKILIREYIRRCS